MLYLRRGNDYAGNDRILLTFTDDAGDPINLEGCTLWWAIKRSRQTPDEDAYIIKTTADDPRPIEIDDDPTTGLAYVTLTAEETADLPRGAWWYSAQGKDGSERIAEVGPARVTIEDDVIGATSTD